MRKLVPEAQIDNFIVDLQGGGEVVEYCGFVAGGELVLCIARLMRSYTSLECKFCPHYHRLQ